METKQQMVRENKEEKQKNEGQRDGPQSSPPSSSSSPSHEFSFTISLHPSKLPDKTAKSTPSFAIDLTPADEIFFHGHLLPLHLLSHLPVSPRTSTNSLDSFTLPITELIHDDDNNNKNSTDERKNAIEHDSIQERNVLQGKGRGKSKSFSLFGMQKRRKDHQEKEQKQRKNFGDLVKRYMKLVKPFLSFKSNNRGNYHDHRSREFERQPYSFSGNLLVKSKRALRGRRGEFTAPASMNTSPTNSGLLVASGTTTPTKSDSTMEELQAAIQAAIAHCKKSIAAENESKFP